MSFYKKRNKFYKFTCITSITCGLGWFYSQLRKTQDIFTNAVDTNVLSKSEPSYMNKDDFLIINVHDENQREHSSWNDIKFSLAKRLLVLTHHDNKFIRTKAVRQLAKIKTMDPWHFSLLSQMITARTAVGLARTANADHRLFIDPPVHYLELSTLVDLTKELLVNLHTKSQHPCLGYFISRAFVDLHDIGRFEDHDSATLQLKKYIQSSHEVLPMCLESILHHVTINAYAKDLVELNGLPLLMEIHNKFANNVDITATMCRIISYLSRHSELLDELFKTGWIGLLATWLHHTDVRVSIPAAKALANLDPDEDALYLQRLYVLHPARRTTKNAKVDVVFVHGLLGGVFFTWRQRNKPAGGGGLLGKQGQETITQDTCRVCPIPKEKRAPISDPDMQQFLEDMEEHLGYDSLCKDYEIVWEDIPSNTDFGDDCGPYTCPGYSYNPCRNEDCYTCCWPRDWLAADCDDLRIIGVNYETNLSMWAPLCPIEKLKTLEERSAELVEQLHRAGLGRRPIVWVTHSMGGLLVKKLLSQALDSQDPAIQDICKNTKGVVFYSTPHNGSSVAKFSPASAYVIWPSIEVQELQEKSPKLLQIHQDFLEIVKKIPIKIITFVETKPTIVMKFKFLIVDQNSGNPGIGEYYEVPLDHLGICKPASRHSFLYQKVLHFVKDTVDSQKSL